MLKSTPTELRDCLRQLPPALIRDVCFDLEEEYKYDLKFVNLDVAQADAALQIIKLLKTYKGLHHLEEILGKRNLCGIKKPDIRHQNAEEYQLEENQVFAFLWNVIRRIAKKLKIVIRIEITVIIIVVFTIIIYLPNDNLNPSPNGSKCDSLSKTKAYRYKQDADKQFEKYEKVTKDKDREVMLCNSLENYGSALKYCPNDQGLKEKVEKLKRIQTSKKIECSTN